MAAVDRGCDQGCRGLGLTQVVQCEAPVTTFSIKQECELDGCGYGLWLSYHIISYCIISSSNRRASSIWLATHGAHLLFLLHPLLQFTGAHEFADTARFLDAGEKCLHLHRTFILLAYASHPCTTHGYSTEIVFWGIWCVGTAPLHPLNVPVCHPACFKRLPRQLPCICLSAFDPTVLSCELTLACCTLHMHAAYAMASSQSLHRDMIAWRRFLHFNAPFPHRIT